MVSTQSLAPRRSDRSHTAYLQERYPSWHSIYSLYQRGNGKKTWSLAGKWCPQCRHFWPVDELR